MNPLAKVYILSGYSERETKTKAQELGAQGFFTKPVNIFELLKLL
jgi:DNA-binding response OmpR family regulator